MKERKPRFLLWKLKLLSGHRILSGQHSEVIENSPRSSESLSECSDRDGFGVPNSPGSSEPVQLANAIRFDVSKALMTPRSNPRTVGRREP